MAIRDDIAAIRADGTKSDDEKRATIYGVKVDALVAKLATMIGQQWTVNSVTYRIPAAVPANGWEFDEPIGTLTSQITKRTVNGTVILVIVLQRTGATFNELSAFTVTNPPVWDGTRDIDAMSAAQLATFGRAIIGTLPLPVGA